jgi:hypothetical protein
MYLLTPSPSQSWAPIVISVFAFLFTTGSILFLAIRTLLLVRRTSREAILANGGGPYTPLWNTYKPSRWWFFVPVLLATLLRAIFIAFARVSAALCFKSVKGTADRHCRSQNHGWVQTVALVAIEFIIFVLMCIFTPFNDKSSNGMNITIQILRCIISGALIVFNTSIGLNEIIRFARLSPSPPSVLLLIVPSMFSQSRRRSRHRRHFLGGGHLPLHPPPH